MEVFKIKKLIILIINRSKILNKLYKIYYYSKYSKSIIKKANKNWIKTSTLPGNQIVSTIHDKYFNNKKNGYFIEVGAYNGVNKSNTYILEKFFDWSGICVEPNNYYFEILKRSRSCICLNDCVDGDEKMVDFLCYKTTGGIISENTDNNLITARNKLSKNIFSEINFLENKIVKKKTKTLLQILNENNAPRIIDFLSLDVEGAETRILENFSFDIYTFKFMMIERPGDYLNNIIINNGYFKLNLDIENSIQTSDYFYAHKSLIK